jgi:hypothetical protein
MTTPNPATVQAFRELKAANQNLIRSMSRQKAARAKLAACDEALRVAKRDVELLLLVVQPELPGAGVLDSAEAGVAQATLDKT